jgi:hypothetical protein
VLILMIHGPIQILFENQYCETECPCLFRLAPRHVIGTQKSHFVFLHRIYQYAAFLMNMVCPSCLEVYHNLLYDLPPQNPKTTEECSCPCDDLVEVEKPPRSVMALSYIAQALVVTIVGLNMGFRYVRHCMRSG